jgi:ATP-dependent Lon protease
MEVIELAGYTDEEKLHIARLHLLPKQLVENGITKEQLTFDDEGVLFLIHRYTREAGLRNLEREIGSVCRKVARAVTEGNTERVVATPEKIRALLGPERYFPEVAERTDEPGVAVGLVWTPMGGDIIFIEATKMTGKKSMTVTGNLGDVMKESAQAALSYIRSKAPRLGVAPDFFESMDIHIHVPAGAVPKDGPSAGVTIATALTSLLVGRPVRHDLAMTGEITLRGKVLPVGGIKKRSSALTAPASRPSSFPSATRRISRTSPKRFGRRCSFSTSRRSTRCSNTPCSQAAAKRSLCEQHSRSTQRTCCLTKKTHAAHRRGT